MDSDQQTQTTKTQSPSAESLTEDLQQRTESQRPRAADAAQHAADAARKAAENLQGQEAWLAGLVEQGADKLADLSGTLRDNDLRSLLAKIEDLARRQPVLFTGAAAALGFALTRAVSNGTKQRIESGVS